MSLLKYFKEGSRPSSAASATSDQGEASSSSSKEPISPDESSNKRKLTAKEYESKRVRKYQEVWTKEYPWILHDGEKVYCKPCRSCYGNLSISRLPDRGQFRKYSKDTFVVGSTNLRRSSLSDHQTSEGHKLAVLHVENRNKPSGASDAEKCVQKPGGFSKT